MLRYLLSSYSPRTAIRRPAAAVHLVVEPLGDRCLPSGGLAPSELPPPAAAEVREPEPCDTMPGTPFEASGTFAHAGQQHNLVVGTLTGQTASGEELTGHYTKWFRGINGNEGAVTLVFADGSLTFDYHVTAVQGFPKEEFFSGTYVITGGTGAYAGATGCGTMLAQSGGGDFSLSGVLQLPA